MAENKKSILVYADWIDKFEELEDDEAGRLIKHFFRYVNDLNPEYPDRTTKLMFIDIKNALKRDLVKWEDKSPQRIEKARAAGLASAEARKLKKQLDLTNELDVQLNLTKSTVSVSVSDSVTNIKSIYNPSDARSIDPIKFITFFNSIRNTKYQATAKVKQCLKARCKEYSKEDIIVAIKNAHLDDYHKSTNFKYLTPEFILRTDKIEKFLNAPKEQSNEPKGYSPQLTN
jgi:uncharacterized phage protein (TIGR02220 family)